MGQNLSLAPIPPAPWIDLRTGLPTPPFYRFMVSLLSLSGGDAPLTIDEINELFFGQPAPPSAGQVSQLQTQVEGSLATIAQLRQAQDGLREQVSRLTSLVATLRPPPVQPAPAMNFSLSRLTDLEQDVRSLKNLVVLNMTASPRLASVNVNYGSYGDATHVGTFTADDKGRITKAANVAINVVSALGYTPAGLTAQTFTQGQAIAVDTSTTAADYLDMQPTDYGVGKPRIYFQKSATATTWEMGLYDSVGHSGTIFINAQHITLGGDLTVSSAATVIGSSVSLTNGAGAGAGTLTNAPSAGNPTKWIGVNDNGTTRYVPAW